MKIPYNPKDNDTFDVLYSDSPVEDMEVHMFKQDGAMTVKSTKLGAVRGNFHSESLNIARNHVLQFPEAKTLGLKALKSKDLYNLLPLSLIKRYSINLNGFNFSQQTPIYFNPVNEKFVLCLDKRFLRDLQDFPNFKKRLDKEIANHEIVIQKTDAEQILLQYDSLDDLYKDKTDLRKKLHLYYKQELSCLYPMEDVIVVQYAIDRNERSHFRKNDFSFINFSTTKHNGLHSTKIEFDFLKAKKFSKNYYFYYDKEGELNLEQVVHFDKEKQRVQKTEEGLLNYDFGSKNKILIMPYTPETWQKLNLLKNNLTDIFKDLTVLLNTQKTSNALDQSLSNIQYQIGTRKLLQITDESSNPKKDKGLGL